MIAEMPRLPATTSGGFHSVTVPSSTDLRPLYSELRSLNRHELRRVLIFVKGLLAAHLDDAAAKEPGDGITYRLEKVRCGKPGCTSCPHGPYWYAYFREGDKLRSRYIGRQLTPDSEASAHRTSHQPTS
jgi:hypothetical protein